MRTSPARSLSILTIAPLPPNVRGGIEEYAYSVVESQRQEGLRVTVVTTRFGAAGDRKDPDVVTLFARMVLARPLVLDPRAYVRVLSEVRRADVVHVHMPFPLVEAFAAFCAKLTGRPLIATYQMDAVLDEPIPGDRRKTLGRWVEGAYVRLSAGPTIRLATCLVTSTVAYRAESPVLSKFRRDSIPIHQGIDRARFRSLDPSRANEIRARYLRGDAQKLVVFVGRLVPYKGLDYLLDAAEALRHEPIEFVLGGTGPLGEHLREEVSRRKLDRVSLIGFVPDADLTSLLYAADLVVSPSTSLLECTPISLLYAVAAGTRVVGTSVGGTAETIPSDGVRGLVIPARDSVALTAAIRTLLGQPARSFDPAPPRFWEDVARDYTALMLQIASKDSGRGAGPAPGPPTP